MMDPFVAQYAKLLDSIAAKAGATTSETEAYLNLGRKPISREAELRFQNPLIPYTLQERKFIDLNHSIARNLPQIVPNPAVTTGEPVPPSEVMEKIAVSLNELCKEIGVTNKRERQFGKVFLDHLKSLENKSALDSTSQDILNTIGKILSALESIKATNNANWESNRKLLRERFTGLGNKIASDTTSQGILNTLQETQSFLISNLTAPLSVHIENPTITTGEVAPERRGKKVDPFKKKAAVKFYIDWKQAKTALVKFKSFCKDKDISFKKGESLRRLGLYHHNKSEEKC